MEYIDSTAEEITTIDVKLRIYSKMAILAFSALFTTIFGALLVMHTLRDIGKQKTAYLILAVSIAYTVLTLMIINIPEKPITPLVYLFNLAGGFLLSAKIYKTYIPNSDSHRKKKIWKPLIISTIIAIPLLLVAIYGLPIDL